MELRKYLNVSFLDSWCLTLYWHHDCLSFKFSQLVWVEKIKKYQEHDHFQFQFRCTTDKSGIKYKTHLRNLILHLRASCEMWFCLRFFLLFFVWNCSEWSFNVFIFTLFSFSASNFTLYGTSKSRFYAKPI